MTDWQLDLLVAQIIQSRVIRHWRDHAVSRLPRGVYGSRMNAIAGHRHVDLGIALGIVSASLATGETMTSDGYFDLIDTLSYSTILSTSVTTYGGVKEKMLSFVECVVVSAPTWTAFCLDAFEGLQL